MGDVISEAKLLDPRNRAKVEQSLSLIFRGKAGIAGRDPALRPFVNALILKGARSAEEINRRIQVQKQNEIRAATAERVLGLKQKRQEQQIIKPKIITPPSRKKIIITKKRRIIPLSFIPIPSLRQIKSGALRSVDFVSGGALTERKLNKRGQSINEGIEQFNKNFGGRELSEAELSTANTIADGLSKEEENLSKDRDEFAKSVTSKIFGVLRPFEKRKTKKETEVAVTKEEKNLANIEQKISETSNKFTLRKLKAKAGLSKRTIENLKTGTPIPIHAGEFPVIPATSIPFGVTKVVFLGTQKKAKGGKIITDIAFKTSRGKIGIAKGVSITKGKRTSSVVLGRSGKVAFKFPSGKKKLISIKSFIGKEVSKTKLASVGIKTKINVLRKAKKVGTITKIQKNIKALQQAGVGRVAGIKGKKFLHPVLKFPSGKIKTIKTKGILFDDFASLSTIFTKKQLSLIIGKTITRAGAKSQFIGMIKGKSNVGKVFSIADKQQFNQALNKVISTAAAALTKSKKTGGLTKLGVIASASDIAAKIKPKPTRIKPIVKTKVKPKPVPPKPTPPKPKPPIVKFKPPKTKTATAGVTKPVTKVTPIPKQKQQQDNQQKQRQKQKQEQLQKQRQKLIQKLKQRLSQKQRQKLSLKFRQIQKQLLKLKAQGVPIPPPLIKLPKFFLPKFKKRKPIKKTLKKKKVRGYNVFARPLKKTKKARRPKLIKVNKVPLRKKRAKDLRNYITDTSLSRTARIKKTTKKPRKAKLKFPKGYAKRTKFKFRRHRIIKGKRRLLPKGKVIERRKRLLDTIQEKRKIGLRRRIRQITPKRIIKRTIRRTPTQKKVMLQNLAKGRRVRMANLKRRKGR